MVRHPLQPFDTRNFDPGALVTDLTWSFDRTTLEGARALVGPRSENGSFLPEPLPALDSKLVELDDLVRFVGHPVRAFLRQRLRISLSDVSDEIEDGLAVELDGLQRWGVGQRLLEACLAGTDGRTAILAEIARGTLPPGRLGHPVIKQLYPIVEGILTEARALMPVGAEPEPVDVHVELADGRLLTGTVSAIGDLLLQSSYSRVAAKHRLSSWVRFLAATATHPERGFAAATVGRARGYGTVTLSRIAPFAGEPEHRRWLALEHLRALIELYDRGMREPLPIYCATSAAYAHAASTEEDAAAAAGEAWTSRVQVRRRGRRARAPARSRRRTRYRGAAHRGTACRRARARMAVVGDLALWPPRAPPVGWSAELRGGDDAVTTELQAPPFDVTGPLPRGVTVLEASAGTGKTYAIAALAARYVADGIPLERVLLVTFTRMATGELRERVRERLLSVLHGLDQVLAGVLFGGDQVVELLAEGPEELVRRRRNRLARALANFDAATIATTHGFCQEVLGGLGIAADLEPNVEFVEDLSDLLGEVVDDLYVRRFHGRDEPPFSRAEALQIANIAVENPDAAIAAATGDVPDMRRRLALAVRQELEARKQRLAVMTYDDLLTRLDAALSGSHGESIAARLQSRYDVVLVDEFQDTDPMQWNIMRRAFAEGERALVLIADPKQAIYAFRGADVYAYLDAARAAVTRATLTINWRSDQALIDAYDALFANAKLGDEGIVYRRVRAADANCARRLHGAPHGVPAADPGG